MCDDMADQAASDSFGLRHFFSDFIADHWLEVFHEVIDLLFLDKF